VHIDVRIVLKGEVEAELDVAPRGVVVHFPMGIPPTTSAPAHDSYNAP